jgi:DNA-binding response OmpR family regulator
LLVKGIRFNLQNEGYEVITGSNGLEAVQLVQSQQPDLVVLDVMMPEMDGLTACSKIREFSEVPIIMLTAKTDDMDKLIGFDHGVDDYLTKPFNILELKARIRALLRRSGSAKVQQAPSNTLTIGSITLDLDARNAYRSGVLADLTAKEFDVIEFLMRNPNRVYSREALLDTIWAYEYRSDIRTVDVHIRRLREKLEENSAEPKYIMTKWGVGYYFKK